MDGHAYAYRAFYAIRNMKSPEGRATNAIFGFVKMLARMRAMLNPSHLIVVWDGGLSAERMAALPGYKAQRPEMPDDLASQLDEIGEYLKAARIASYCEDGVEADDYIAFLARQSVVTGLEAVIASSDKDFMQLVQDKSPESGVRSPELGDGCEGRRTVGSGIWTVHGRIGLFNPNDKTETIWGDEQVRGKTGVSPQQVGDWLSLMGDSVDNIPGVPGVGPKTATDLLNQFGSVDGIYARLGEVKSERVRGALRDAEADVRRNQELVRLKSELPWNFAAKDFVAGVPDADALAGLFRRWGFRTMLAEVEVSQSRQGELLPPD